MKARPILFSGPMVRALLAGTKTQTRRIVTAKHLPFVENLLGGFLDGKWNQRPLPYGQPGDLLWVRETWAPRTLGAWSHLDKHMTPLYRADKDRPEWKGIWRPSIHMPRWASRLTLRIKAVRVERLQEISEADVKAEGWLRRDGVSSDPQIHADAARDWFGDLWVSINGPDSWSANPWVWVIEFDVIQANVDQVLKEAA